MKPKMFPSRNKSISNLVMIFLSFLATVYVAGRLWQDATMRLYFLQKLKNSKQESSSVSVDEAMLKLQLKEQGKMLADLQMELSAAKAKGYVSHTAKVGNSTRGTGRVLAVIGINTGFGHRDRRDSIRNTWMPSGELLHHLQEEYGIIVRFVIGRSANRGDMSDRSIDEENAETQDFMILENHVEGYDELPKKTKIYFSSAVALWEADFYVKVDDDVYLNIEKLCVLLKSHTVNPHVYIGCMKSGEIYTEKNQRWHEPEWWKFGDAKTYFRHSTGQVYALSRTLAHYVAINSGLLHEYRNEDVSLGSWMIGLDVNHEDERRLCCASPPEGECARRKSTGDPCIAVFDWQCSGLCSSVNRMKLVHDKCS